MPEENHDKLVNAILDGQEKHNEEGIGQYIEEKVPTSEIRVLFKKILASIPEAHSGNNEVLHNIRKSLGHAYGTNCIANLGFDSVHKYYQKHGSYSFEELGQTNFIRKIQVVAAEALHWWEKVYFVAIAVILPGHYEKHRKQYYDCFAFQCPNNKNGGAKWEKKDLDEVCQKYNEKMEKYLKNGSSAMHSSHLKMDEGGAANRNRYRRKPFTPKAVYIGEVKSKTMENEREDAGSATATASPYVTNVITPTYNTLSSKGRKGRKGNSADIPEFREFHLSQGSETNFLKDEENISTIAHMYIIAVSEDDSKNPHLPPAYRHAMNALLQHLSVESVCEVLRERQKTLEKHAQMLGLLKAPLSELTSGLARTAASTQLIQSILYDPPRSIFAASSRVSRYFEVEGKVELAGGVNWTVQHKWGGGTKKPQDIRLTVLAIVFQIFGLDSEENRNLNALGLWNMLNAKVFAAPELAMTDLSESCHTLLFCPCPRSDQNQSKETLWADLRNGAVGTQQGQDPYYNHWHYVIKRFKSLLFDPYKFRPEKVHLFPLALILLGKKNSNFCLNFNGEEFKDLETAVRAFDESKDKLFDDELLYPYPRPIVLWALILYITDQWNLHCAKITNQNGKTTKGNKSTITSISISISYENKDSKKGRDKSISEFGNLMSTVAEIINKKQWLGTGGDTTLPWFNFAFSCKESKECSYTSTDTEKQLSILYGETKEWCFSIKMPQNMPQNMPQSGQQSDRIMEIIFEISPTAISPGGDGNGSGCVGRKENNKDVGMGEE